MADFWSGQVGNNYCPQIRLSASVTSYNDTSDTISWTLDYVAHGYGFYTSGNRQWYANIDGQQWSGTANVYGATGTVRLGSGTKVVAKTHSDKNVSCSASMSLNGYWNGAYINWAECSGSVFTGKKTSYTVSYNANGGSGAPGAQTKWYGETLTLSGTRPSRTGYNFSRWNTNTSNTGTAYNPGGAYTANSGATLYAIWSPYTYTVSYNANGGTGAPGSQTKTYGVNLTLSSTRPTRTNYNFLGWGVSAGSTSVSYSPGSIYSANAAITLYAVWQLAYTAPRITNLVTTRSNSSGTVSDSDSYAKVSFSWTTDRTVSSIKIQYKRTATSSWSSTTVSGSGTSGTVSKILSNIDPEYAYDIKVTVADSGGSSSASSAISGMTYIIDFKNGGNGVAIGKTASLSNIFEVEWPTRLNKGIDPIQLEEGKDFNSYTTPGFYMGGLNATVESMPHHPVATSGNLIVIPDAGTTQIFIPYKEYNTSFYIRSYYGWPPETAAWSPWRKYGSTLDMYPVGSIYMSVNSTNPSNLFGGTWVEIQGRFLFGRDGSHAAGTTGGEASHKLTTEELPAHSHSVNAQNLQGGTNGDVCNSNSGSLGGWDYEPAHTNRGGRRFTVPAHNTNATGSGKALNTMPPYLAVYIWKRTA